MSKSKAPSLEETLPKAPEFQEDPVFKRSLERLEGLGGRLTSFDFTGDLAPLQDTININPDVTRGFFDSLQPFFSRQRKDTISQLAANNQLESSVTADRLAQIDTDVANLLQGRVSDQLTQALENRIRLFGTGLNATNSVVGYAQANQAQRNSFNLENYQNLVDRALASQKASRGGLGGALTGAAGGAAAGATLGSIIPGVGTAVGAVVGGIGGGLYGGLSRTPGAGGQLLTAGAGAAGSRFASYTPGSVASNQPFTPPTGAGAPGFRGAGFANYPALYQSIYGGLN